MPVYWKISWVYKGSEIYPKLLKVLSFVCYKMSIHRNFTALAMGFAIFKGTQIENLSDRAPK